MADTAATMGIGEAARVVPQLHPGARRLVDQIADELRDELGETVQTEQVSCVLLAGIFVELRTIASIMAAGQAQAQEMAGMLNGGLLGKLLGGKSNGDAPTIDLTGGG